MKAILMAAGKGTRISRAIGPIPKCCVSLGKSTLVENTIAKLRHVGIEEIAIVTGYRGDILRNRLANAGVRFYRNPFFEVTNSIASLWFARDFLAGDDVILLNADVFLELRLTELIVNESLVPVMFYDSSRIAGADYRFYCHGGHLLDHGKGLSDERTTGEYIGVAKIEREFLDRFKERLEAMIRDGDKYNLWWENVLYSFMEEIPIPVRDVAGYFWAEVDYVEDYNRILAFIESRDDEATLRPM